MIVGVTRLWLPVACAVLQLVSVSTGSVGEPTAWGSAVGFAAAIAAGLSLLARHRRPLLVLGIAVAGQVVQVLVMGPVFPVVTTVAVFGVARGLLTARSPVRSAAAIGGAVLAVVLSVGLSGHLELAAPYVLMLVAGLLAGLAIEVRGARVATRRREMLSAERLRIARDLHDTVGHGMGAITVQAGAGRMAVAAGATEDATRALQAIEDTGRAVLRDVRWMVGLLREEQERPRLADVLGLVAAARRSGLQVTFEEDGQLERASDGVGEVAYRIVQEAITNVLRHSGASAVRIRVAVGTEVEVEVHDEGAAAAVADGDGNGLRGMRERAAAMGGQVKAGPDPGGGWSVRATLPVAGRVG
jgi:signal transduction histidine kinase